ncbi:MAG: sugar phosphate nucleotidyltransferase [Clostridium sp.]|nr:sugar phosphate nucleotidyltransferase [Clostridium sp.]
MKPTLLVLAAGMGSRYGGLKQLDGVGPAGQTIMDYSIYDAIRAGFGKVVFVIRKDFEKDFNEIILSKYKGHIPVEVAFQSIDDLPAGFSVPEGRVKPWGTGHAIRAARNVVAEPFVVINADDFYGRDAFEVVAKQLAHQRDEYSMVGFRIGNTMTENGSVSRGVCSVDADGNLASVVERTAIAYDADRNIKFADENGVEQTLEPNTPVSMNFWGFGPDLFGYLEREFLSFLQAKGSEMKSEFYIPTVVSTLIANGEKSVKVLDTESQWFGVTYPEDRPTVVASLAELHAKGAYPEKMF